MRALLATFALLLSVSSFAQSFDCARASTAREKAICSTPALRSLDTDLGKEFTRIHTALPDQPFLADQRSWLKGLDASCSPKNHDTKFEDCLTSRYNTRLAELRADRAMDNGHWIITTHTHGLRPQILTPNAAELKWNALVAAQITQREARAERLVASCRRQANGLGGDAVDNMEDDVGWHIAGANSHLIVTKFTDSQYCGGAHPTASFEYWNWSLDQGRVLTPADVFGQEAAWKQTVTTEATKQLRAATDSDGFDYLYKGDEFNKGLLEALATTKQWLPAADGLHIQFQQYQVAAYVFGMPQITIPWSALKPTLNHTQLPTRIPDPADDQASLLSSPAAT